MTDSVEIAARTQSFNEAVRAFTPPAPSRHAKLMPFKDGIVELRQKGGSLRLIRELLATINVAVGTDTIARFLAEVNGESTPQQTAKRPNRVRRAALTATPSRPVSVPGIDAAPMAHPNASQSPPETPVRATVATPPAERPRTRGPRIADPSNL